MEKHFQEERGNSVTHLIGVLFALSSVWMVGPAASLGWRWSMGVLFFIVGMFLMFLSSTIFHCLPPGRAREIMRRCDHISIYVMIACSYTPICVSVVGGAIGWTVFALLWAVALGGSVHKMVAIGRHPRLSLALYLLMGWSVVFIAKPVYEHLSSFSLLLLLAEGVFYTVGTYFYARDWHRHYHTIWHIFVLLGALAHWGAVLTIMLREMAERG